METNNNIKDFNIAEVLRYAPKRLKLYSPLLGEVRLEKVSDHDDTIVVTTKYKSERVFFEDGKYDSNGECLLFPSVNHRCWNNWQNTLFLESIGSVCVDTITGNKYILDHNGTFFGDGTGSQYSTLIEGEDTSNYLLNSRYASPSQAKEFFKELNKNGYEWKGDTKKLIKTTIPIPKFKVSDVIKHKPTGEIAIIKYVCSDYYVLDNNHALYFESQDMWELVASKVNPSLENRTPTSQEVYYAVKNMKSLEDKVSILTDEILALKERVKALEIQEIKQCSDKNRLDSLESKMIILDSHNINNRLDALERRVFPICKCSDKAGDSVTLEEMKG